MPSLDANAEQELRQRVRAKMLSKLGMSFENPAADADRAAHLRAAFDAALAEESILLTKIERSRLFEMVVAQPSPALWEQYLLLDKSVEEFFIIGANEIFVRRSDAAQFDRLDEVLFDGEEHLVMAINHLLRPMQQAIDAEHPFVQLQTPDGSSIRASLDIFGTQRTIFCVARPSKPRP